MPQRNIPVKELTDFIMKVRHHSTQESDEKRHYTIVRTLANKMYRNYIGYNYRGEPRLKGRDERPFVDSKARREEYERRWKEAPPAPETVRVKFLGHAGFQITGTKVIFIDPFLSGNRFCPIGLELVRGADLVLVTHDHPHHLGDAFEICRRTKARLVGVSGLAEGERGRGVSFEPMNLGGAVRLDGVVVRMIQSVHVGKALPTVGFVVELDGYTIYHAGDTALFEEMRRLGEEFRLDLACVPIGDRYTMGVSDAAEAVRRLRPRHTIPMHFNTTPEIEQDPEEFKLLVAEASEVVVLRPGGVHVLDRRRVP